MENGGNCVCTSARRPAYFRATGPSPDGPLRKGSRLLTGIVAVIQLLISLALIFLILLHAGRGGGVSDMFGGGMSSGNVAGSTVVEKNLDRLTVIIAISFAVFTLWLTWLMA
mgnify:CR=1 FL=1